MGNLFWVLLLSGAMIVGFIYAIVAAGNDNYAEATFWMTIVILNSLSLDRITREN